ncbi:MAG: hypothetical protein NC248_11380 [Bacteroides sp.]|nr:hypothetical protein [Bacteroides sp.]MCM1391046.1 hypothetical protein [Bacteroides sp.]
MKHLKEEFDKLTFKEVLVYSLAIATMTAGMVMLFLGMYIPPEGQIHESILTAFGIICVFSASLLGISIHYANELSKFKETVNEQIARIGKEVAA